MPAEGLAQAKALSLGKVSGTWDLQVISEQRWDRRSRVGSRECVGCRGVWGWSDKNTNATTQAGEES